MNKDKLDKYTKEELVKNIEDFSTDIISLMKDITIAIHKFKKENGICAAYAATLMALNDILQSKKILYDIINEDKKKALIHMRVHFNELKEEMEMGYARNI